MNQLLLYSLTIHCNLFLHVNCLFHVQMLGSCPVFQAQGSGCTDEAVQQIVSNAKKVSSV